MNVTEAQATVLKAMGMEAVDDGIGGRRARYPDMMSHAIDWNFTMGTVVPWARDQGLDVYLVLPASRAAEASFDDGGFTVGTAQLDNSLEAFFVALSEAVGEGEGSDG